MFKKLLLVLLTLGVTGFAQTLGPIKRTVAFVYGQSHVRYPDGTVHVLDGPLGTAFFVGYPDARGGHGYMYGYVVTAKHVLKDEDGTYLRKIKLRLNTKNGTSVGFAEFDVSDANGNLTWLDDKDDPNADVAILMAHPNDEQADFVGIPVSLFADADSLKKNNVSEGDQVYLVGLMPQFTGENHNYPVVRHGYIAMLADEKIPLGPNVKENVYALELGSWQGQSGSPVFVSLAGNRHGTMMLGESYSLLGVMLGYFYNMRPFETVSPTNSVALGDTSNVGISYVLPADEILKVLNSKEAQEQRDADIRRRQAAGQAPK